MRSNVRLVLYVLLTGLCALLMVGCGGGGGSNGGVWRYDPGIPLPVTNLKALSGNGLVSLSWSASASATSYNIYYVPETTATVVTKANGTKISLTSASTVVSGLINDTKYYFMVTAVNKNGESIESVQVSATPGPFKAADLVGDWYFHTLVNGPDAKWERGQVTIDSSGNVAVQEFEDSSGVTSLPAGYAMTVDGVGLVTTSGGGAHVDFHGTLGSRKTMIIATYSHSITSQALIIFQKKKDPADPVYSIQDIMGTGSGQNPIDPTLLGNGPTRFAYHQLSSGAGTNWEYCNGKVGQNGNVWVNTYKDITYWDYGSPEAKIAPLLDYQWKVTSFGIDADGLVSEYWNYVNTGDFVSLYISQPHEVVFQGRMTADRTMVIGVGTRVDAFGAQRYVMRIMELCFKPWDQALPVYNLATLTGSYSFHKLSSSQWAYGTMDIAVSGATTFPDYLDSAGNTSLADTFTLQYYPDPGIKGYTDFANFITPDLVPGGSGSLHYYDGFGVLFHTYYDFWSWPAVISDPSTWRSIASSPYYYNEHGSQSYYKDMFVMTRTDASGDAMYVGIK